MEAQEIIGQIFSFIAMALTCLSYQFNSKRKLLIVQSLSTLSICISYFFLGASVGMVLNVVCLVRNFIFYFQKEGSRYQLIAGILLAVAIAACGALSWEGPISLLMIFALAINTVVLSFGRVQPLRKSIFLTSTMVLLYNVFVFSMGGILNECVAIGSAAVGLIRFARAKNAEN